MPFVLTGHPGRVHVKVHTDKGLVGSSSVGFSSIRGANHTLQTMLDEEVAPLLVGRDSLAIRLIHEDLKWALEEHAIHGMTMYALTAVNVALWDIFGQGDRTTRAPPGRSSERSSTRLYNGRLDALRSRRTQGGLREIYRTRDSRR